MSMIERSAAAERAAPQLTIFVAIEMSRSKWVGRGVGAQGRAVRRGVIGARLPGAVRHRAARRGAGEAPSAPSASCSSISSLRGTASA